MDNQTQPPSGNDEAAVVKFDAILRKLAIVRAAVRDEGLTATAELLTPIMDYVKAARKSASGASGQ